MCTLPYNISKSLLVRQYINPTTIADQRSLAHVSLTYEYGLISHIDPSFAFYTTKTK